MIYRVFFIIFLLFFNSVLYAESDIDQWKDSDKTYKDLIDDGWKANGGISASNSMLYQSLTKNEK